MNLKEIIKNELERREEQLKINGKYLRKVVSNVEIVTKTDEDGNVYQEACLDAMTPEQKNSYESARDAYNNALAMNLVLLSYVRDKSGFDFDTSLQGEVNEAPYATIDFKTKDRYISAFGESVPFDKNVYSYLDGNDKKEYVYGLLDSALRERFYANSSDIKNACIDVVTETMSDQIVRPSYNK